MPHDLEPEDVLSRFLVHNRYINYEKGVVNTSVFSEKHPNGFSVFKTTALDEATIWGLATTHVITDSSKNLYGRCDLQTRYYLDAELTIDKQEPPPLHYNVFGMPVTTAMDAARKLTHRQIMVTKAKLVRQTLAADTGV